MEERRTPEALSEEDRQRLHRAYQRLRNASQALEALTVVEPLRGRWTPTPAPAGALEAAHLEMHEAYREIWRCLHDVFGWEAPAGLRLGGG